jgi:hypothetical protein
MDNSSAKFLGSNLSTRIFLNASVAFAAFFFCYGYVVVLAKEYGFVSWWIKSVDGLAKTAGGIIPAIAQVPASAVVASRPDLEEPFRHIMFAGVTFLTLFVAWGVLLAILGALRFEVRASRSQLVQTTCIIAACFLGAAFWAFSGASLSEGGTIFSGLGGVVLRIIGSNIAAILLAVFVILAIHNLYCQRRDGTAAS